MVMNMNSRRILCSAVLALTALECQGQGSLKITFDGPPFVLPTSGVVVTNYSESGLLFTPASGGFAFTRIGPNDGGFPRSELPDNGSAYIDAPFGDSLAFGFTNGFSFDLISVDLAELTSVVPSPVTVHVVGYRQGGSVVMIDFVTDGVIDGTGPQPDFQTFHFGNEWSDLTRVEFPTSGWSMDNLLVSIPEPSGLALSVWGGMLALGLLRWRTK